MFSLPAVVTVPLLNAMGFGSVDFSALAAYVATVLTAVMVATGIGILSSRDPRRVVRLSSKVTPLRPRSCSVCYSDKAAA
jgi:hypothetical protein